MNFMYRKNSMAFVSNKDQREYEEEFKRGGKEKAKIYKY